MCPFFERLIHLAQSRYRSCELPSRSVHRPLTVPTELPAWARRQPLTRKQRLYRSLRQPGWLIRDGLLAVVVGVSVLAVQKAVDDSRADRDRHIAAQQSRKAEQLENLRFVRDRAWDDQNLAGKAPLMPFAALDLAGVNLSGLTLRGADFRGADLQGANLVRTDLRSVQEQRKVGGPLVSPALTSPQPTPPASPGEQIDIDPEAIILALLPRTSLNGANLCKADLTSVSLDFADLTNANLNGAKLFAAHFEGTILYGADLRGSDLTYATVRNVVYDETTLWPTGFDPPAAVEYPIPPFVAIMVPPRQAETRSDDLYLPRPECGPTE